MKIRNSYFSALGYDERKLLLDGGGGASMVTFSSDRPCDFIYPYGGNITQERELTQESLMNNWILKNQIMCLFKSSALLARTFFDEHFSVKQFSKLLSIIHIRLPDLKFTKNRLDLGPDETKSLSWFTQPLTGDLCEDKIFPTLLKID